MGPQDSRSPGAFLMVRCNARRIGMAEIENELRHYLEGDVDPRAALEWSRSTQRGDGRPEVLRPARDVAARLAARRRVRRVRLRGRARLRRLLDPRLAGDLGERHAAHAGRVLRDSRPVHGGADALARVRDRGSDHARAVREGPAARREARRGVPPLDRHRGHVLRRPGVRVLRLRRGLVHERAERGALQGRRPRGLLELGRSRARLHGAGEARLLPGGAARHAARPADADGADARAARHPVRVPPPRGRRPPASARSTCASSR